MIVVLQARLCSTRLPGKAFFSFFGQNMIERACSIAKEIKGVDRVILATGNRAENLALQPYVEAIGAEFFVGSEDNVLQRFCQAIDGYRGDYLLRMTCDNYLIQPDVIEGLYQQAQQDNADYAHISPLSHFSGEIVKCDLLRACYAGNYSAEAKEHVTWDIRADPRFRTTALPADYLGIDHHTGITLDTLDDLLLMKRLERDFASLKAYRCLSELRGLLRSGVPIRHV